MPYALNQIVLKAMAKDPADRYQSAAEFARDLRAAREGGPVQAAAFDAGGERTRVMGAAAAGTTSGARPADAAAAQEVEVAARS